MTGSVPSRQLNVAHDNATIIAAHGGGRIDVHQRIGTHLIDELAFDAVPPLADVQPSRLLNAGNRVVRFTGRKREIAELEAWRDDSAAVAVRLVHGSAGQGKTRLAHRFAELSGAAGWITLRARHSRDIAVRPIDVQPGRAVVTAGPILVVVDYAERWPLSDLLALLVDRRLHGSRALRVLLLARPVGNWWYALTHRLSQDLGIAARSVELTALGATRSDSQNAFGVARACFADALGVAVPDGPVPHLDGSILTIHMAALAHVLAVRIGDTPPSDPGELSAYLLARERSHWQSMYDNDRRVQSSPQVMGRAVHVAALTRSLDFEAAVAALKSTTVADSAATAGQVLDDHAMCYPPHDPTTVLEPLYPDRLAEDFVALQTPGHRIDGFRADPWAAGAPRALLDQGGGNPATVLPLLIDGARRWSHLPQSQLLPLLRDRPQLAVEAGSPTLSALAAARWMTPEILAAIESVLPVEPPADLHAGIAALGERLAADLPPQADDPVRKVAVLLKRGWRLTNSGRITDGVRLLAAAVATARLLTAEEYPTELERALRLLGRAQVQAGNWAAVAAALGEAVGLWTTHGPRVQPPADEIARCLTDLSLALWRQGIGESLAVRHRAIVQLRRLVATDPRHRLTLARVLVQQAEQLRQRDRYQDSLEAIEDAARLMGEVAGDAGSWLEPDFAAALLGRARTLQSLRELAGSAAAASAAVRILEQLARRNVAFDEDLAGALGTEAAVLAALGRWTEAIEAQEKAVSIFRRLGRINGPRYNTGFAQVLTDFGRICRDAARRYDDALRVLAEAIELMRSSRESAAVRTRMLVDAESIGADLLDASGRHREADALRKVTRQRRTTARPPQSSRPSPARGPSPPDRRGPDPPSETEMDAGKYAREIAGLDPAVARSRLEQFSPHNIAVILLAVDPRYEWLARVFQGLEASEKYAVLREFVWFDGLTRYPVILRFVGKQLLNRTTEHETAYALSVLETATPAVVAGVLGHRDWATKARFVLARMDRSRAVEVMRMLPYDPGRLPDHADQAMYWW
jgi:tetratricopeptide (TPR) repeat protein